MSTLPPNSLPANLGHAPLPVLRDYRHAHAVLAPLRKLARDLRWRDNDFHPPAGRWNEGKVTGLQVVANAAAMQAAWSTVKPAASAVEIRDQLAYMFGLYGDQFKADEHILLVPYLVQKVIAKQPSRYALAAACEHLVETEEWPPTNVAKVLTVLRAARQQAAKLDGLVAALPLMEKRLNPPPPPPLTTVERYQQECEEQAALAKLWDKVERCWPPPTWIYGYTDDEVRRLGFRGLSKDFEAMQDLPVEEALARIEEKTAAVLARIEQLQQQLEEDADAL